MALLETIFPDHFSRSDRSGVIASVFFTIAAFIVFLIAKPPSDISSKKSIARLESFSNNVRYKESGSVSFYNVIKNEDLQNSDEIFTGDNSGATVKFSNSKTILKIPSSSLVKIEEDENGESIEIKDGLVDIIVKKDQSINVKVDGITHQIKPSQKESSIKAYFNSGKLHLFTKSTGVKISNTNGTSELISNKDATPTIVPAPIEKPSFSIVSPGPGEKLESISGFKISTDLKSSYEVILSKNADFSPPVFKSKFEGTSFIWEPTNQEGDYFLKIADKENSKTIPITLANRLRIDGESPLDGETIKLAVNEKIKLSWSNVSAKSYKVIIQDDQNIESSFLVHTNEFFINHPKGSHFKWSVAPEISSGKYLTQSKPNSISLMFKPKINFLNPPGLSLFKTDSDKASLSWDSQKDERFIVKGYDLVKNVEIFSMQIKSSTLNIPLDRNGSFKIDIASIDYPRIEKTEYLYKATAPYLTWDSKNEKELRAIEESAEVSPRFKSNTDSIHKIDLLIKLTLTSGATVDKKLIFEKGDKIKLEKFGKYCISALPPNNLEFFHPSDSYCFNFIQMPAFDSIPKASDVVLSYIKYEGHDSYKLNVPTIKRAVKYHFEIYRDTESKTLVYSVDSESPEIFWTTNRSGIYYLKYKVFDNKKRESGFSPFSKLIFPISPLSDW